MSYRFPRRFLLMGGIAASLAGCASKFRSYNGPEVTRVRLYKSERLLVLDGAQGVLKTYPVGLGFAPDGHKQFEGDVCRLAFHTPTKPTVHLLRRRANRPEATSSFMAVRERASTQQTSRIGPQAVSPSPTGKSNRFMRWCAMERLSTFMPETRSRDGHDY